MIWLTWRQHRLEGLITALVVVAVAGLVGSLVVSAQPLLEQIRHSCSVVVDDSCGLAFTAFDARFGIFRQPIDLAFIVLPVLSGMFIGAPLLAREFEQGTAEMVWTQGITRRKWLVAKLAILGSATIALAGILAVAGQEWAMAVPDNSYSQWFAFDIQGPEVVAYALFSFGLGVAAGAAIGRTVPAMAVVLVGFLAVRAAIAVARKNFLPPVTTELSGPLISGQGQAWLMGNQQPVDMHGNSISAVQFDQITNACLTSQSPLPWLHEGLAGNFDLQACWHEHGIKVLQTYQPAERFPLFQGIETAIFVLAAIALLGLAVWLVRRRA
jgi:ABC-type transport system involved in multi-copper enzyme maturation permease subunit